MSNKKKNTESAEFKVARSITPQDYLKYQDLRVGRESYKHKTTLLETKFQLSRTGILTFVVLIGILISMGITNIPTGYVTISQDSTFNENLSLTLSSNYTHTFAASYSSKLKSLTLSGSISKTGYARAYLEYNDQQYLIFDSSRLDSQGIGTISGLVVKEEVTGNTPLTSRSIRLSSLNDGKKDFNDIFKFDTTSEFGWDVDYSKLCTKWDINSISLCYGSQDCCALIGLESSGEWNSSLYLSYGRYDSTDSNAIKSQVIYANYSLDIENPYSDIIYSNINEARADFYESAINFNEICIDTCILPELNFSSCQLIFIIENSTLTLSNISYSLKEELNISINPPSLIKEITNITLYKNQKTTIDLSEYFSDLDNDKLTYSAYQTKDLNIIISGSKATIIPSTNYTGTAYTFFSASDRYYNITSNLVEVNVIEPPISLSKANISEALIKPRIIINQPVRWVKVVNVSDNVANLSINISSDALNVTVKDLTDNRLLSEDKVKVNDNGVIKDSNVFRAEKRVEQIEKAEDKLTSKKADIVRNDPTAVRDVSSINKQLLELKNEKNQLTGYVVAESGKGFLTRLIEWLFDVQLTGYAVVDSEYNPENSTSIIIDGIVNSVEVEYYTEAPAAEEMNISSGKRIVISSDTHYEDILAYTYLDDIPRDAIRLYHMVNNSRVKVIDITYIDSNNNSLIDEIEWVVPSLSNQTYEVSITILNVYSHPALYGNWTVYFNTAGTANLSITAAYESNYTNETTRWSNESEDTLLYDLKFLEIKCGNNSLSYKWQGENCSANECSVFIANYSCNQTGYEVSKVVTPKRHVLKFNFGGIEAYAYNDVLFPQISFVNPTPPNAASTANTSVEINISITEQNLSEIKWNWNGTNYSYYDNSLVLMMNFDNVSALGETGNKTVDVSRYGNNGTCMQTGYGMNCNYTAGKYGNTLQFDGVDDYLDLGNYNYPAHLPVTFSGWFYRLDSSSRITIFSESSVYCGFEVQINESGRIVAGYGDCGGTSIGNRHYIYSVDSLIPANQWHHIVVVIAGKDDISFYVDGANMTSPNDISSGTATVMNTNSGIFKVGSYNSFYPNASIDELRLWNRSLTEKEVYQQYVSNLNKYNTTQWYLYVNQSKNATGGLTNGTYTYQAFASDTTGNWNNTELRAITIGEAPSDSTPPTYTNFINNGSTATKINGVVNWSVTLSDNAGISGYLFAHNNTGTLTNGTFQSGNFTSVNQTVTITKARNNYICAQFWFNDTSNNINQTNLSCFTVANTAPTTPTVYYPVNGSNYSTIAYMNYSSSDADGEVITYNIYINRTLNASTNANLTFWNASDGTYSLNVSADDGVESSANSSTIVFTLDATAPTVNILYPTNGLSVSDNNIDFNASAVDTRVNSLTYYWVVNGTVNATTIDANTTFNASDGYYNLTLFVSDGVQNGSDAVYFILDITSPTYTNFQNNASTETKINGIVNWSITLSDNNAISGYIFAHNNTGTLTNGTFQSGNFAFVNQTITITKSDGNYICGQYWFNDTSNNINQTNLSCFTVANSPPNTTLVLVNSSLLTNYTNEDIYCYANVTDTFQSTVYVNYTWYNNSVEVASLRGQASSISVNNLSLITTLGRGNTTRGDNWTCSVQAYNGTDYEGDWNNATINIRNMPPIVNWIMVIPSNPNTTSTGVYISANLSDEDNDAIIGINFTVIAPNGTYILNGSANASYDPSGIWNSTAFNTDSEGQWKANVTYASAGSTYSDYIYFYVNDFPDSSCTYTLSNSFTVSGTSASYTNPNWNNGIRMYWRSGNKMVIGASGSVHVYCIGGSCSPEAYNPDGKGESGWISGGVMYGLDGSIGTQDLAIGSSFYVNKTGGITSSLSNLNPSQLPVDYGTLSFVFDDNIYDDNGGSYTVWAETCIPADTGVCAFYEMADLVSPMCTATGSNIACNCPNIEVRGSLAGNYNITLNASSPTGNVHFISGIINLSGGAGEDSGDLTIYAYNVTIENDITLNGGKAYDIAEPFEQVAPGGGGDLRITADYINISGDINLDGGSTEGSTLSSTSPYGQGGTLEINASEEAYIGDIATRSSGNIMINAANITINGNIDAAGSGMGAPYGGVLILNATDTLTTTANTFFNLSGGPGCDGSTKLSHAGNATLYADKFHIHNNFSLIGGYDGEEGCCVGPCGSQGGDVNHYYCSVFDNSSVTYNLAGGGLSPLPNMSGTAYYYRTALCEWPKMAFFTLNATSANNYTTDNLTCYARAEDAVLSSLDVYYEWYNGTSLKLTGKTTVQNGTLTLISTLGSGNITSGDTWNCSGKIGAEDWNASYWNSSLITINAGADATPPIISSLRNTSTTNQSTFIEWSCSENCNYTIQWYNESGLVDIIYNNTFASTHNPFLENLSNYTTYLINLTVWDSSGNNATNKTFNFTTAANAITADTTPPTYTNFQNNASTQTKINGIVNWSIDLADETSLSFYTFAHNQSGTLTNVSNSTLTSNSAFVNNTLTITKARDNYICAQYWFNDTSNNINQTNLSCFTVANSIPSTPNITFPLNNSNYTSIPYINFSSSDADSDTITYNIYINNTLNISTTVNITQWNASDGYYNLTISATDGTNTSSNSSSIFFTLDSTPPTISNLRNTSTTYNSTFIEFNCSELCNYTIRWYNESGLVNTIYNNTFALSHAPYLAILTNYTTYIVNLTVWDSSGNNRTNNTFGFTTSSSTSGISEEGTTPPQINFTSPTPANGTITTNTSFIVNVSITESSLRNVTYNWNGTNYSYYDNSLALMYNFDNVSSLGENNTFVVDMSSYGNNGTCIQTGYGCNSTIGKYGRSFNFTSNQYINTGVTNLYGMGNWGNATITAWINLVTAHGAGYASTGMNNVIVGKSTSTDNGVGLMSDGSGKLRIFMKNKQLNGATNLKNSTWYHVAFSWNDNSTNIYLNGMLENSTTGLGYWDVSSYNILIGRMYTESAAGNFHGAIDELRIWNRSLSIDEVYQQYVSNLNKFDTTQWYLYINQSRNATDGLTNGTYTYQSFASDTSDNWNNTEERIITVGEAETPDTLPPTYTNFQNNASTSTRINGIVNWSITLSDNAAISGY
ncbi:MAG: LamG domain-containing protein, partial [Nanoarchaeota archaeon]|nr:LamG domain-containing protein [Nanoarchaeota archaeon]